MPPTTAVGVLLPRDLPAALFRAYAVRAEQLGFDELWVVEDCFFRGGIAQAATALAATERLRVGIGILPAAVRNPAFTALEVGTLAELFPGRVDIGIGHGMPEWMRQVGAWPTRPLRVLETTLQTVRALLRGERVDLDTEEYTLTGVQLESPPAVVPLVLAGVRGPRSLAAAGRSADGTVLAEPVTPEYLAAALAQIDAPGPHRVVAYNVCAVDDDADAARRAVRPALEWIGDPGWAPHIAPLPFAAELAGLRASVTSRAEFGQRLPDAWVDQLSVVGTPDQARARIAELHAAGATSVVLAACGPDPLAALESVARAL